MIKIVKSVAVVLVLGTLFTVLSGCQKKEGPLERTGKQLDKAAEKTGQQFEKAGDKIKDAAKDVKK